MNDHSLRDELFALSETPPDSLERHAKLYKAKQRYPVTSGFLLFCQKKSKERGEVEYTKFYEGALWMLYAVANQSEARSSIIMPERVVDLGEFGIPQS